jgi:hypothetical protein
MHPYLTSMLVEARMEDLRQEAAWHRLVVQARTATARPGGGAWRTAVKQVTTKGRLFTKPAPATARAPQLTCCPA